MFALPGRKKDDNNRNHRGNSFPGIGTDKNINVPKLTPEEVEAKREEAKEWADQVPLHRQFNGAKRSVLESKAKCYENQQLNEGREAEIMVKKVRGADTALQEKTLGLKPIYEDQNQRVGLAGYKAEKKCDSLRDKYANRMRAVK